MAPPRDTLYKAFVDGFLASAEGWNGEYPFDSNYEDIAADEDVRKAFEEVYGDA